MIGKQVNVEMAYFSAGAGGVQLTFWYEGSVIGAFDAVGAGLGGGVVWGDGTFKKVN